MSEDYRKLVTNHLLGAEHGFKRGFDEGYRKGREDAARAIREYMAADPNLSDLSHDNPFEGERYAMQHAARLALGEESP